MIDDYVPNPDIYDNKHVGTREQHLHDLLEHWSVVKQLMDEHKDTLSWRGENVREELGIVVEYLTRFAMREFREFDVQQFYKKEVNSATS